MEAHELLEIHKALWKPKPPGQIHFDGTDYPVAAMDTPSRKFRSVAVEHRLIITQNLAKPTTNTSWVNAAEGRQLTWVIINNSYIGKVTTDPKEGKIVYYVYKLNPERVVYSTQEGKEEEEP